MKLEQSSIVSAHCTVPLHLILIWFFLGHWETALLETGITDIYSLLDTYMSIIFWDPLSNWGSLSGSPQHIFFKYLQVRDFIRVQQGGKRIPLEDSEIDSLMWDKHNSKSILSYSYNRLMSLAETKASTAKLKWETDTVSAFEVFEWKEICSSSQSFSYNSWHKLLQFNLIHRVYLTPHRLHKISSNYSEYCPRCTTETGLLHMFWTCRCLEQCWRSILDIVKGIVGVEIPASPWLTLLGDLLVFNMRVNTRFIRLVLIAANKCIAINWKSEDPPGVSLWLKELLSYLPSEKMFYPRKKNISLW